MSESLNPLLELHLVQNVPLFIKAFQLIEKEEVFSVEEIVSLIEELEGFENDLRAIRHLILDATYVNIITSLLEPVEDFFAHEYEQST